MVEPLSHAVSTLVVTVSIGASAAVGGTSLGRISAAPSTDATVRSAPPSLPLASGPCAFEPASTPVEAPFWGSWPLTRADGSAHTLLTHTCPLVQSEQKGSRCGIGDRMRTGNHCCMPLCWQSASAGNWHTGRVVVVTATLSRGAVRRCVAGVVALAHGAHQRTSAVAVEDARAADVDLLRRTTSGRRARRKDHQAKKAWPTDADIAILQNLLLLS